MFDDSLADSTQRDAQTGKENSNSKEVRFYKQAYDQMTSKMSLAKKSTDIDKVIARVA